MKQSTKKWFGVVAASALVLGAASAAVGQGMGMGPGMGGHQAMMGMGPGGTSGMGPGMAGGSPATTKEQMAQTRSALGITAAQDSAWQDYEQAVLNQSALMSAHRESIASGGMPAGDQRTAMHQQGSQMAQQTAQARQTLYQILTPAQKAKADTLIGRHYGPPWGASAGGS